jgi:S-DNA-T family DNA segregation ATPase FtsK/SpoIIIE
MNGLAPTINMETDYENYEKAIKIGDLLTEKMDEFGMRAEVENITIAPQVIKFDMIPASGTSVRKLPSLKLDLQYEVGAKSLRIIAPVPGKKVIGIEIDNPDRRLITLADFQENAPTDPLSFPLGIDTENKKIWINLPEQGPHMLIGGATGGGKSTALNVIITSLISRFTPEELNLILIDTKRVELTRYEGIPHLAAPVAQDVLSAVRAFAGIVKCMEKRYEVAARLGAKDLNELNSLIAGDLSRPYRRYPHVLVIVDELADLMMMAKHEIEDSIVRIAQKARAMGIHLILATQTPRREIVTGTLKANLSSRLTFATTSELDSKIILDQMGGGQLLGSGDALFSEQGRLAYRMQSPFVSSEEINTIVNELRDYRM